MRKRSAIRDVSHGTRIASVLLAAVLISDTLSTLNSRAAPIGPSFYLSPCSSSVESDSGDGAFTDSASQICGTPPGGSDGSGTAGGRPAVLFRQVDCGPPTVGAPVVLSRQNVCNFVRDQCWVRGVSELPRDPRVTTIANESSADGGATWLYDGATCDYLAARAQVTPVLVHEEIQRRVPGVAIGVAPPGGRTLVNVQTVLWVVTPVQRSLGTVTLLGAFRVALRIHVEHVEWVFGDGATDRVDTPGRPYRTGEHCATMSCPGHYGHTYTSTGAKTVSSRVIWSGQYSVNGGAWQDVPGTVTGPTARVIVQVEQARGVLVPDPGQR